MYYVYALIDPRSNLPFYVGKGKKENNRHQDHFKESKKNNSNSHKVYKINYLKSLNLDIPVKILEDNILDENIAYQLETFYIKKYGRKNIDKNGILTNICLDNKPPSWKGRKQSVEHLTKRIESRKKTIKEKGIKPKSIETRQKLSKSMIGEKNHFFGKSHSTEFKLRHSKRMLGNKNGGKTYLFIDPTNRCSIITGEFYNFCKKNNLVISTMEKICKTGNKTKSGKCKGWIVYKIAETGMDPYSGLFELFELKGLLEKQGNRYKYITSTGEEILEYRKNWTGEKLEMIISDLPEKEKTVVNTSETDEEAVVEINEEE